MRVAQKNVQDLEKGQLWKVDTGYVYIVELGKRFIHYKMLRQPKQRAVKTQMTGVEALTTYLKNNAAVLVD